LKFEADLDRLEEELNEHIKITSNDKDMKNYYKEDTSQVLRAQYIRREINEIESKVNDCDERILQYSNK
jgi:hypothetical protein